MTVLDTCRKLIELGEKATKGPWQTKDKAFNLVEITGHGAVASVARFVDAVPGPDTENAYNSMLIVELRNHGPQIAKALIVAMEALDTIESMARIETREECHRVRVAMDRIEELLSSGDNK